MSNPNAQVAAAKQQARVAKPFPCTWYRCSKSFGRKSTLKRHYEGVHLKLYEVHCPYCDHKLSDSSELTKHIKRNHPEYQGGWTCASCGLLFKTNDEMINHKKQAHGLKYVCDDCGEEFETEDKWDDHVGEYVLLNDGFGDENIEQ